MLLSSAPESISSFKCFLSQFVKKRTPWSLGSFPIQTIYIDDENTPYRAEGEVNEEDRVFPNSSMACFEKADLWEALMPTVRMPVTRFPDVCVYEIRDVAEDEFSHWSATKFKNSRKVK